MEGRQWTSSGAARVVLVALVSASFWCFWKSTRLRKSRRKFPQSQEPINPKPCCRSKSRISSATQPNGCCSSFTAKTQRNCSNSVSCGSNTPGKLLFASQTGTSEALARGLSKLLLENNIKAEVVDPRSYEPEDISKEKLVIIVASTWEDGKAPDNAAFFAQWLEESSKDFRVGAGLLSDCKFAVFGIGSKAYGLIYNATVRAFHRQMTDLGGVELLPMGEGDQDEGNLEEIFGNWSRLLVESLTNEPNEVISSKNNGVLEDVSDYYSGEDSEEDKENDPEDAALVDLEDIAGKASFSIKNGVSRKQFGKVNRLSRVSNEDKHNSSDDNGPKAMVTPIVRANLEKQVT